MDTEDRAKIFTFFWYVAPCNLVALMTEAAGSSENSLLYYQTDYTVSIREDIYLQLTDFHATEL